MSVGVQNVTPPPRRDKRGITANENLLKFSAATTDSEENSHHSFVCVFFLLPTFLSADVGRFVDAVHDEPQ